MQGDAVNRLISERTIRDSIPNSSTIIVGLSGGPDSVCLLYLLKGLQESLNLKIIAAHLDHGWRTEAAEDAIWCQNLCKNLNIPIVVQAASSLDFQPKNNGSKEEVGRKLRRYFFEKLAIEHQATIIALAHHQDDQIETFFIRLLRGSSVAGLAGIKPQDGLYLRPLLQVTKHEILNYLTHHKISFLIDQTNEHQTFLRNRLRNKLPATLDNIDPRWHTTIPSSIKQLQSCDDFLELHTAKVMEQISKDHDGKAIEVKMFLEQHSFIQRRILLKMLTYHGAFFTPSTAFFDEILRFLTHGKQPKHALQPGCLIVKKFGYFYLISL